MHDRDRVPPLKMLLAHGKSAMLFSVCVIGKGLLVACEVAPRASGAVAKHEVVAVIGLGERRIHQAGCDVETLVLAMCARQADPFGDDIALAFGLTARRALGNSRLFAH